jgi:glycosyltransferase involved in cell wall biosynthesis
MDEYISIIIAAYNSENWIERCLDSVLAAADDSCEIIVVDDGSTDRTVELASRYEDEDGRVTVYTIEHGGMSVARKYGVDNCNGDSVMFVDGDDVLPINAIVELRNASDEGCDIVCGNIIHHDIHGEKRILYTGTRDIISGPQYAIRCLQRGFSAMITGKKFARYLFDVTNWNTDNTMGILNQRVLLLQLACTAVRVAVVPTAMVYTYISRNNSASTMFALRLNGVEMAWNIVRTLPLPSKELTEWGLDVIDHTLMQRGYPFSNDYAPAAELRERGKNVELRPEHRQTYKLLCSEKKRLKMAQKNLREGKLTLSNPHLSFIVPIYNNVCDFKRTLDSIMRTGLRNTEIIAIDDGSNRRTSIRLTELSIQYPRMVLHRNPSNMGAAQSRRIGLNIARGKAIFFVNAGDCVERQGVFEAAIHIGNGADLAYFGVKSQLPYLPFVKWNYFVPSECDILQNGIESMAESHVSRGYLNNNLRAIALNRRFITTDMLCERGVKYGSGYITMLKILLAHPVIAQTDACGYVNCSHDTIYSQSAKHVCRLDVELSLHVLNLLHKTDMDKNKVRDLVEQGSFHSLTHIIASVLARPISGGKHAEKLVYMLQDYKLFHKLYMLLKKDMPNAEQYLQRARKIVSKHRISYLFGHQQNY